MKRHGLSPPVKKFCEKEMLFRFGSGCVMHGNSPVKWLWLKSAACRCSDSKTAAGSSPAVSYTHLTLPTICSV